LKLKKLTRRSLGTSFAIGPRASFARSVDRDLNEPHQREDPRALFAILVARGLGKHV
jgi:hypothetical protein